jgi:hypothetical protein
MRYEINKILEVREITCGEVIELRNTEILSEFIDPNYPDEICQFHDCWDWLQARSPRKKIFLITDEIKSTGNILK